MFDRLIIALLLGFLTVVSCQPVGTRPTIGISASTKIILDPNADSLVHWAAHTLAQDLEHLSGHSPAVIISTTPSVSPGDIVIGQAGTSLANQYLPSSVKDSLDGAWEKFYLGQQEGAFVIGGSDVRGTVYGLFELAERLGISPWIWWADVRPTFNPNPTCSLPDEGVLQGPAVKYRGIFLNDEDWGLQPWAAHTFEPNVGDIGPKTYEKIFQLLLRLKANTIWPAMHESTRAFFSIKGNKAMAEKYHFFVGSSHAEPMLRNNVDEWDTEAYGPYNYLSNKSKVNEYWDERVKEVKRENSIFTMGMRGTHDSKMEGVSSKQENVRVLDEIITTQRKMLEGHYQLPPDQIPQVFIPYKEVLEVYNHGLQVPEDITLMWTDDNYGYIRRLSNEKEQQRSGGAGVYYHLSYWGRPHDYLWLATTQPGLIYFEMMRAYQNGAQTMWIANVGDIKPAEYDMEFFLDLAWDVECVAPHNIEEHLFLWAKREFGAPYAADIQEVMSEYYRLAMLRKPEYMGWSQTEPITQVRPTAFSSPEEVNARISAYRKLYEQVDRLAERIPQEKAAAFYQLVTYPVKGAALMNEKFLFAQHALWSENADDREAWKEKSELAFEEISQLTDYYNDSLSDGKWHKMMSMQPRELPAYQKVPEDYYHQQHAMASYKEHLPKPIFVKASEIAKDQSILPYQWKAISSLGYSDRAMTLWPLKQATFDQNWPYLEYQFEIEEAGEYIIEVRCLPTHANNFDHQIALRINGESLGARQLNTRGRSEAWKQNVLRNYVAARWKVRLQPGDLQKLQLAVNQTGIVIDQWAILPSGAEKVYEIPL
ncbi:glycosyl hydrolase 115 family protein [Persicobacter diffluens]|uniref:Gylcosyl hydrolase 115 C-terminal domain-containing protein n=1 Tax=Persicobacter diffluens TaxID=981 RepID=A0AAN5AN37_9BACT|nr:hypothetical protein PEDI_49740 [Persicobacter diffluens]